MTTQLFRASTFCHSLIKCSTEILLSLSVITLATNAMSNDIDYSISGQEESWEHLFAFPSHVLDIAKHTSTVYLFFYLRITEYSYQNTWCISHRENTNSSQPKRKQGAPIRPVLFDIAVNRIASTTM